MPTLLVSHRDCLRHAMQRGHPERPERLAAVLRHFEETGLAADVVHADATPIGFAELDAVHDPGYLRAVYAARPERGLEALDADTFLCPDSLVAAELAAGAVRDATLRVIAGSARRAFCAVRPPGHHAERDEAMGFCFFNNVAVGAAQALAAGLARVAIVDFDVHHGNGTVDIFRGRDDVLVCSSFQHPFYPHRHFDVPDANIVNTPLEAGTSGSDFRRAIERDWVRAIERHRPELILVSAGFDAHRDDPLGGLALVEDDFRWVTALIVALARDFAQGRVVSVLEGGYDLNALARSAAAHVEALLAP
jgi:acetoin utilization deacetylase AcuC-like enzyme